jgi:hypothetical protein
MQDLLFLWQSFRDVVTGLCLSILGRTGQGCFAIDLRIEEVQILEYDEKTYR